MAPLFSSVRTKFIVLFLLVVAPIIFFLYYNNYYAMRLVESKETTAYRNMLAGFVAQADNIMHEAEEYLINVRQQELDVSTLDFEFSDDTTYELTKLNVFTLLSNNLEYMKDIDSFMLYSLKKDEVVLATSDLNNYEAKLATADRLMSQYEHIDSIPVRGQLSLTVADVNGSPYLIRLYPASETQILGAWIDLDLLLGKLNTPYAAVWSSGGRLLANRGIDEERLPAVQASIVDKSIPPLKRTKEYLQLSQTAASHDLNYVMLIPTRELLANLSFFQKVIQFSPAAILLLVLLYVGFMQRTLIRPMQQLIFGMRRLSQGNLDTRLTKSSSQEFTYMNQSFNSMAEEIKTLKLHIYEEQLRVQKAEMKQLQMQINPHFYANTLNLINGFAQLGDYTSVQEMTRLLAAYFRFLTSSSRPLISLREEIEHIQNYLYIQKYRYPHRSCST